MSAKEEALPESWKPKAAAVVETVELPSCDLSDPAQLEAWFGNYSFFDHFRHVVLSNCKEMLRAKYVAMDIKVTETRLEDLARTHPNYVGFLIDGLNGRTLREREIRLAQGQI